MKCLNENCPLNKNKKCDNPVVLEGRAPCYGKVRTQKKEKISGWNNSIKRQQQ